MKGVDFEKRNCILAENQPEYEQLPVFIEMKQIPVPLKEAVTENGATKLVDSKTQFTTKEVPWSMTACFELSDREKEEIARTGKIWYTQMVFGNQFQPVMMSTLNPFDPQ